jgi:hypothetical protein
MIDPVIFGGKSSDKDPTAPGKLTLFEPFVQPEMGQGVTVRQIFTHFQNLNMRLLIEDLRRGLVTRGNWSFAEDLCPVAHGMPTGQAVGLLRYLSQAVDLPRACRLAAQETGMPARSIEHFVLSWDSGAMSAEWLLVQLQTIWSERLTDADAVQGLLSHASTYPADHEEATHHGF